MMLVGMWMWIWIWMGYGLDNLPSIEGDHGPVIRDGGGKGRGGVRRLPLLRLRGQTGGDGCGLGFGSWELGAPLPFLTVFFSFFSFFMLLRHKPVFCLRKRVHTHQASSNRVRYRSSLAFPRPLAHRDPPRPPPNRSNAYVSSPPHISL